MNSSGLQTLGSYSATKTQQVAYILHLDSAKRVVGTDRQTFDMHVCPALQHGDVLVDSALFESVVEKLDQFERMRFIDGDLVCDGVDRGVLERKLDSWMQSRKACKIVVYFSTRYDAFAVDTHDTACLALAVSRCRSFALEDVSGTLVELDEPDARTFADMLADKQQELGLILHDVRRKAMRSTSLAELTATLESASAELEQLPWYKA